MEYIIVSRHKATTEFVRSYGAPWADAPQVASATADLVRGKSVAGNLPLHLAASAAEVWAVEFSGTAPRGAEYTLAEMKAAGARLAAYTVHRGTMLQFNNLYEYQGGSFSPEMRAACGLPAA